MELLATCKLIPTAARRDGNCSWCGKKLPRTKKGKIHKSRRWCSRACSGAYGDNHFWSFARKAAAKRDGHRCTICGKSPYDVTYPVVTDYKSLKSYHAAIDRHNKKVKKLRLEIHHINPLKGRGYKQSCLHHQANLRTLCHDCHKQQHH